MQVSGIAGRVRVVLCVSVVGSALAAGAAGAQAYYPSDNPPPPATAYSAGYSYPAPAAYPQASAPQNRYADPRYADPSYESYQQPTAAPAQAYYDSRYFDPRYMSPEQARAYRRWLNRYYGQGYASNAQPPSYVPQGYAPQSYGQPGYAQSVYAPPAPRPLTQQIPIEAATPSPPAVAFAAVVSAPVSASVAAPPPTLTAQIAPAAPIEARGQAAAPEAHLPHRLIEAAEAYADFMHRSSAISAGFKSGANVAEAVRTGAGYEPKQFQEGAIAYAALTALQEPEFVQGVRMLMAEGDQGALFAEQLTVQPQAALNIRGADLAAARAAAALHRHGEHLFSVGTQVKQAAYDVQHAEWSKAQVSDPDGRLAAAKAISAQRATFKDDMEPLLTKAVIAETTGETLSATTPSPIVARGLAIAALSVLGQLHGDQDPHLFTLLSEAKSADCLKMAKLNLFQCLSVARPHYEDIFCLGEHAMKETGQCVVKASGYTPTPVTLARAGGQTAGRK